MDFHQLRVMTIEQLREVAEGVEGLTGYTQMRKHAARAHLRHLTSRCTHHDVVGIDKRRSRDGSRS